jgi:alpha-tubulin suppressor-like RCC1 family protein
MDRRMVGMVALPFALALCLLGMGCTALLGIDGSYRSEADATAGGDAPEGSAKDAAAPGDGGVLLEAGPVVAVVAGRFYSCARYGGGVAQCWGQNVYGQFGNGYMVNSSVPTAAMGSAIDSLYAGGTETCAVTGTAGECSGLGGHGELDNGVPDADTLWPVATTALPAAPVAFASGVHFTCAIVTGGDVYCAGDGSLGALGTGSLFASVSPVKADLGGAVAVAIAAEWQHVCALTRDGAVFCWGDDSFGQIGNGETTAAGVPVPFNVPLGGPAGEIGVGESHSCAIVGSNDTASVWCWGDNSYGQLGAGSSAANSASPVQVTGLSGVAVLAIGGYHGCVGLAYTGGVACWGKDGSGELGNNDNQDSHTPVMVAGISVAPVSMAAGGFHTCALVASPNVLCWGSNDFGQLGNGDPTFASQNAPIVVQF